MKQPHKKKSFFFVLKSSNIKIKISETNTENIIKIKSEITHIFIYDIQILNS